MDIKKEVESCIRQGGIYRSQGLLNESRESYKQAGKLIKQYDKTLKNKKLLVSISKKIIDITEEIDRLDNASSMPEMSKEVQDIIKTKFSFSKDDDVGQLEGAVALAKFGQFERALNEFRGLMDREPVRVDAAKNIIRCHMALDTMDNAIADFQGWMDGDSFLPGQLKKLRLFLQGILKKKGIDELLPEIDESSPIQAPKTTNTTKQNENVNAELLDIDISSVGITPDRGERQGETIELDVSFQSGNMINLLISSQDKDLIEWMEPGLKMGNVQFYSPIAMFTGTGRIASKTLIESGPKQGDYSVDIEINSK